ncbi:DUF397 domain-containing protein [Nocardia terpenica]|uniref:DUF397 domain-containing protein n=1 Tax=Nocardia terpenica TaxID=455432 RepID=A0A291RW55_9NOCA|nr:DUF397 domain-containing protein [Nocardia terpenica]ATL71557.1 DUF397 domain-containing protein [Nocardia terpenica]
MSTVNNAERRWRKASFSRDGSNCVEVGWQKSSFSRHGSNCVEINRPATDTVLIRDTKDEGKPGPRPVISVPAGNWEQFLEIATGRVSTDDVLGGVPAVEHDSATGTTTLRDAGGTALVFTPGEWTAFISGVKAGEFAAPAA